MTFTWHQVMIDTDRTAGRQPLAVHIGPAFDQAAGLGLVDTWWYIRKSAWRVRFRTDDTGDAAVAGLLDKHVADGHIIGWHSGVYEPETFAFGGPVAMDAAHQFFQADSLHLLERERAAADSRPPLGSRERTALLCAVMLRGAGLDRFEQADVWAKVAAERPLTLADPAICDEHRRESLVQAMTRLLTVDVSRLCTPGKPLDGYGPWLAAFEQVGQALRALAQNGRLRRGLRAVLAHHIIFHANRAGISVPELSTMAALAMTGTFGFDAVVSSSATPPPISRVPDMTTVSDQEIASPNKLRAAMTQRLSDQDVIRTAAVRDAFDTVPRHRFLPHADPAAAYADEAVYTKTDGGGAKISAASQPRIVAMMLGQLDPQPGEKILEAGAGTGYNAALIGHMVGTGGHVTTIDVDDDLVTAARAHLAAAGVSNVDVILGDGALGHPDGAPYDRAIATVGVWDVPTPWLRQLKPGGRLVVPVRLRGAASRSIVFTRNAAGCWRSIDSQLAVFMPLRGMGDDARRIVALNDQQDVTLQVMKDQTVHAGQLAGVLDTQPHTVWTGVIFPPMVPYEWIDLWLALRLPNSIMRMNTGRDAIERGQVTPMFPTWGAMAAVDGPNLAYLTLRPAELVDGQKRYEIGVIGHGPDDLAVAETVAAEAVTWDNQFRDRPVRFELQDPPADAAAVADPDAGSFVIDRPSHPISVVWE
jgi:protein-L-isoaspartate(D-aspartate) O-methyltransferase